MKPLRLILFVIHFPLLVAAQSGRISGKLMDAQTHEPLSSATVVIRGLKDSTILAAGMSDRTGAFVVNVPAGREWLLHISFIGYDPIWKHISFLKDSIIRDIGAIAMRKTGVMLATVEIIERVPSVTIKKDTLEYTADNFKTSDNAVIEELLQKLPGLQVDRDGTIRINGEPVKKILIDGHPFFGDEPAMAARNLLANIVDKVQVLDRKSDRARFTGVDDGQREKTINITIKKDKKDGLIGKATGGYGTDERFAVNGNLNLFSDDKQLSVLMNGNNITGYRDAGSQGAITTGGGGMTRTWNGGANLNQDWGKKIKVNFNYQLNNTRTENSRNSTRQNILADTTWIYNQSSLSKENNTGHSLGLKMDYQIDTMHLLNVFSNINYNRNNSLGENSYSSTDEQQHNLGQGVANNQAFLSSPDIFTSVNFTKRMRKTGRSVTLGFNTVHNSGNGDGFLDSYNHYTLANGDPLADSINQRSDKSIRHQMLQFSITYTEPIFKHHYIEAAYIYTRDNSTTSKYTYDFNPVKQQYDKINDSLSNAFKNHSNFHFSSLTVRTVNDKYDYSLAIYMLQSELVNINLNSDNRLQISSTNYYPVVFFNYHFSNTRHLRLSLTGDVRAPGIDQLQPVPDNSNPLYIIKGNPDLKPSRSNIVELGYSSLNSTTLGTFSANFRAAFTSNNIITNITLDSLGRQISSPTNQDGAFAISGGIIKGVRFNRKKSAFNSNTNFGLVRDISMVDGIKGYADNFTINQGINLNIRFGEWGDIITSTGINYNEVRYSLLKEHNTGYFSYNLSGKSSFQLPLGFMLGASIDYTAVNGRAAGYNEPNILVNVFASKSILKGNKGLIRLQGFDLLGRNLSLSRSVGSTYVEDVSANVLQRFFLLSVSYFIK